MMANENEKSWTALEIEQLRTLWESPGDDGKLLSGSQIGLRMKRSKHSITKKARAIALILPSVAHQARRDTESHASCQGVDVAAASFAEGGLNASQRSRLAYRQSTYASPGTGVVGARTGEAGEGFHRS